MISPLSYFMVRVFFFLINEVTINLFNRNFSLFQETNPKISAFFDLCYGFISALLLQCYFSGLPFFKSILKYNEVTIQIMLLTPIAVNQLFPLSLFFSVFSNTDNIIILRKIGDTSTEEKNGTQKEQKNSSFSRQQ